MQAFTSAVLSLLLIVGSHWTLVQTPSIIENQGWLGTEVTVICRGATTLQTVFVAGDALACVLVEAAGTGLMTHVLVQEGRRHTLCRELEAASYPLGHGKEEFLPSGVGQPVQTPLTPTRVFRVPCVCPVPSLMSLSFGREDHIWWPGVGFTARNDLPLRGVKKLQ